MKTLINLTVYILILSGFCGCNGDIFVDDFRTSDSILTLSGNGDAATLKFASSNWVCLRLHLYDSDFTETFKIYDVEHNLIAEERYPFLKGMGQIVCDEKSTDFVIERSNPKELRITVGENARSTHFRFLLIVGNKHETQDIFVEISPSDRYAVDK